MKYQCGCVSTSLKMIIPRVCTTHLTFNKYQQLNFGLAEALQDVQIHTFRFDTNLTVTKSLNSVHCQYLLK